MQKRGESRRARSVEILIGFVLIVIGLSNIARSYVVNSTLTQVVSELNENATTFSHPVIYINTLELTVLFSYFSYVVEILAGLLLVFDKFLPW